MKTILLLTILAAALSLGRANDQECFRLSKVVDPDTPGAVEMRDGGGKTLNTVWVDSAPLLSQSDIARASVVDSDPIRVRFEFTDAGRKKFSEITKQFTGKRIAIVVEGRLLSAPRVNEQISGPTMETQWDGDRDDALRFARTFGRK